MNSLPRRNAAGHFFCIALVFCLAAGVALAQSDPPWKTPGNPFFNNPTGYARDLHSRYVGIQTDLTKWKAALPTYKREKTGAEMSGLGFFDALKDELELARLREAARKQIEEGERSRDALEREWAQWCEMGLLGSPMPPLSAANSSIEDTYLDKSTYPPVLKKRVMDRIDFNIKYFLEEKAAAPAPTAGGPGAGTFTNDPFNGLQITYSISGAALGKFADGGPFEGWERTYEGSLQGSTLRAGGTVTKGPSSSKEYPGHATVSVWAGDKKAEKSILLDKGTAEPYEVSVNVPAGATAGGVTIHVWGEYRNGEMRFVKVAANLKGAAPGAAISSPGEPGTLGSEPRVRPSELSWGRIYPVSRPLQLAPAGRPETELAQIDSNLPLGWVTGDRFVTGSGGPAVIIFPNNIRAVIGADSKLELLKGGAYLGAGSALFDLLNPGWNFKLETPAAAILTAGSLFAAQVLEGGATLVAAGIGSVGVASLSGNPPVTVPAGKWVRITAGQPPSAPAPLTKELAQKLFGPADLLLPPGALSKLK